MEFVKTETKNNIFTITLNRPDKRNAFHAPMIKEITQAFKEAAKSKAKMVLLHAEGRSFCAGGDLDWMKSMKDFSFEQNVDDSRVLFEMFEAGYELNKPLVGKVHGHAMGGALGLVAVCDIVAAESATQFCFSEVKWGLVPAVISPFSLRKMVRSKADQLMLTAKIFDSQEALTAGLIHFHGNADEVDRFVNEQIDLLNQAAPIALEETKKLLKKVEGFKPRDFLAETTKVISERRVSEEGQKGLGFFLNKQTPRYET